MNADRNHAPNLGIQIDWKEYPNSSLGDALYNSVRRAIVSGRIPPGTPIKEMDISRETGISRTPVREAVRKLESERLLLRMPGRRLVVTRPNPAEMEEIFLVRSVLEGLAGRIASAKITRANIEDLKKTEQMMGQGAKEKQLSLSIKSNLEFHKMIVDICDVNVLSETLKRFWDTVRIMSSTTLDDSAWIKTSIKEHREIIGALEKKKASVVERLIRNHVIHAGKIFTGAAHPREKQLRKKESTQSGFKGGATKGRKRAT